ncbi:MAG: NADH-quinone oxidoreductase subunit H [Deltaproteobacteria bacterium]|nr:NADH-quinone oxidoreductase subunit H [Deltaproteobacteria bacterium]
MLDIAIHLLVLFIYPPLLLGFIAKTKAAVAGRSGPPVLQPYYDLAKLLRKGAVYSRTTTWLFRAGPIASLAAVISAGLLLPLASSTAPLGFAGDVIAFAYVLAVARFFTMAAALDVGSSFEAMGASREATFGALAEPALFVVLAILAVSARSVGFSDIFGAHQFFSWDATYAVFIVSAIALFAVLLAENSRVPVDDPATHLELTMIHEVMVLDHGGVDLAFILYGAAMKLFLFATLLVRLVFPMGGRGLGESLLILLGGTLTVAIAIGVVESVMARFRLVRVPQFLIGAFVLAAVGLAVLFHRGIP